jgi:hypothetical protein
MIRLLAQKFDWQHDETAHSRIAREAETLKRLARSEFLLDAPRHVCDVFEDERLIGFIETIILTFRNVVITGYQAFFTKEALICIAETTLRNISEFERTGGCKNEMQAE